ncbi:MAG: hypothetical protein V3U84_07595 [Thiotrichaceae bacterium]
MESYQELQEKPTKTDEEKLIVLCIEVMHESKALSSTSERDLYNVLCDRAGVEVDQGEVDVADEAVPVEGETSTVKNPTSFDDDVVTIYQNMVCAGDHLTSTGKVESPELNKKLEEAGYNPLTPKDRDQLHEELNAVTEA